MPDLEPSGSRPSARLDLLSASALKLHVTLLAGLTLCAVATTIEWRRAHEGHQVAWVYCFEWPLFAVMGTYLWWRLLHPDEPRTRPRPRRSPRGPRIDPDDPDLLAWQEYLARQHAVDPPGGPDAPET